MRVEFYLREPGQQPLYAVAEMDDVPRKDDWVSVGDGASRVVHDVSWCLDVQPYVRVLLR